jgi:hypothetical protein
MVFAADLCGISFCRLTSCAVEDARYGKRVMASPSATPKVPSYFSLGAPRPNRQAVVG